MSEIDPELEAGYNLRARHPEREAVYADMARRSAALRASAPVRLDLRYGPSPPETLDYFPAARGARLFVFVHGGYWRALDKAIFSFLAKPFLDAGIAVALTNYGLAPSVPLAEIVAQSDRSIAWLARNAGELGHEGVRHPGGPAQGADQGAEELLPGVAGGALDDGPQGGHLVPIGLSGVGHRSRSRGERVTRGGSLSS